MIHRAQSNKIFDTAIIGGGVLGLWAARHAIKRGEKVVLLEKRKIGAGASGGFLGALMPHMPDNWNAKKQFQFEGLDTLESVIAELEEETGISCDYRRCGRIMPITNDKLLGQIDRRIQGAKANWQDKYKLSICDDFSNEWINPDIAKFGIQHDTLSARVNPRQYLAALDAYVRPRCELTEGVEVVAVTLRQAQGEGEVLFADGSKITAGKIIVANGYEAYPLLQPYMGEANMDKPIGRGVKGQAVLVEFAHDNDLPIVYHDGSYIVPHKGNCVAIGSTSENVWQESDIFDKNNMGFYKHAIELVPALKDAPIIDKWARVRPRNTLEGRGTEPYFGSIDGYENLIALIGGFKITVGVAHMC
jgi:glycine/D-amino acid oxidase-like deaminating enzyme